MLTKNNALLVRLSSMSASSYPAYQMRDHLTSTVTLKAIPVLSVGTSVSHTSNCHTKRSLKYTHSVSVLDFQHSFEPGRLASGRRGTGL